MESLRAHIRANWKAGVTVAFISIPLSIALSVASGAGPVPGVIAGVWGTIIAGLFGGSNYNIIGAAGALTTVLFAATLAAPAGLGAAVLPLIAVVSGLYILAVWALNADRFLYYIPSSVMYGFAGGVAFLIAASQLFDATGLSALKRTGTFIGDIQLFVAHIDAVDVSASVVFAAFLGIILIWKRFVRAIPAVIPVALLGIVFGVAESHFLSGIDLVSLGDKFGSFSATLALAVPWTSIPDAFAHRDAILWLLSVSGTVALISVLETLITAQIGDKITKTQSSSKRELLGLSLANIGSGIAGGLPTTGVFIRTGANIKAGATHRTAAVIAGCTTGVVALVALPWFSYIPMAVIAAILVNTALGLIETHKFVEFFQREKRSFVVALLVLLVTVFEDAGIAVVVGAGLALLFFADRISHGYFDAVINYENGDKEEHRREKRLSLPADKNVTFVTYSIAGFLGYIDSARHAANFRLLAQSRTGAVIIRLRNLFSIDYEGEEMLSEALSELARHGKTVYLTSGSGVIDLLDHLPEVQKLRGAGRVYAKSEDAIRALRSNSVQ